MNDSEFHDISNPPAASKPLQIIATAPANVTPTVFQGSAAVQFGDPANRPAAGLEELGEALSRVMKAQFKIDDGSNGKVFLLPELRRWVYADYLPTKVEDDAIAQVVNVFVKRVIQQDTTSNEELSNNAFLNEDATKAMEDGHKVLSRKHGGEPVPACVILRGERQLCAVAGTFRPKQNLTNLIEVEQPFEGCVDGYKRQIRAAFLRLKKEGSSQEVNRIAHWEKDALGDEIAGLSSSPSTTIPVAGVLGVTKDAKGNSIFEVKSIWRT